MVDQIARDSLTAWGRLREAGGIEPHDRDADFAEQLRIALRPSAATLDEALGAVTLDDLVRAFFGLVQPYVEMFRAILEFFEIAEARQGRSQWSLKIEEEHFDLQHFQKFIETWETLDYDLDVPAIDSSGSWALHRATDGLEEMRGALGFLQAPAALGSIEVDRWLEAYKSGQYQSFPKPLHPGRIAPELGDAARIAMASVDIIRRTWPDRERMLSEHRARGYAQDYADGFSPRTIAQHETDHRLASSVVYLSRYETLDDAARQQLSQRLTEQLGSYPRRRLGVRAQLPTLERILSLPLWQRRHELYAVWIATELVSALDDHECEIHHDNESITFSFSETVVATIHTTRPKVRLYSERRSPLTAPIGRGRKDHVQPDYSFWRGRSDRETCGLVIEVKHYKRGAPERFREVLVDYARAHRQAGVILVSHGPARESFHDGDSDVRGRCSVLSELVTSHLERRAELRKRVRGYVGDPVVPKPSQRDGYATLIAVDISSSMQKALDADGIIELLRSLAEHAGQPVALIDTEIRVICQLAEAGDALRRTPRGETHLLPSVVDLLDEYPRILLITDNEGSNELGGLKLAHRESRLVGATSVEILEVQR
jgi:hypothetical protein